MQKKIIKTKDGIKPIDETRLESFMQKGDFKGAKKLINSFLDQELSPEEKGKVYAQLVTTYLYLSNKINEVYIKELNASVRALKEFNSLSKKADEDLRVAEVKERLYHYEDDGL